MQFLQYLFFLHQEHWLLFFVFTFCISLCVGSFLNVVIYRLPEMMQRDWRLQAKLILEEDESKKEKLFEAAQQEEPFNLAVPNSTCPKCQHKIKPWENIPVLSYLLLKGKCSNCKTPISWRYPSIELATAVLASLVYWQFGLGVQGLALIFMTYCFVALFWIDVDHQLLPDSITLPLLWLGLWLNSFNTFVNLETAVYGAMAGYLSLWLVYWVFKLLTKKEGMGFGDFKLMAVVGAWFGWQVLPQVIFMSAIVGAVLGVLLILIQGRDKQQPMAFGPFIAAAAWIVAVFGPVLPAFQI